MTLSIDKLDKDALGNILLSVHNSSRHSLFSVLRANRTLHEAALPFIYRRLCLNFAKDSLEQTQSLISALLDDEDKGFALKSIRQIRVIGRDASWGRQEKSESTPWSPLAALISRLANLQNLTFEREEQIPLVLLSALHDHHPKAHLHIRNWTRPNVEMPVGDPAEEALARSPCLRSIHAHFYTGGPEMDLREAALNRIIALAPNLESLEKTTRAAGGCVVYGFSVEQMHKQHELETAFEVAHAAPKALKEIRWGYVSGYTLDQWGRFIDLGKLESLYGITPSHEFLAKALEQRTFHGLKHLSLTVPWRATEELETSLDGFLAECHPLESLSIVEQSSQSRSVKLTAILNVHGPFLKSLALHKVESPEEKRTTLSLESLRKVNEMCPELEQLEFDVNRSSEGMFENQIYGILSAFPKLSAVTLHMDLDLSRLDNFRSGPLSKESFPINVDRAFTENVWYTIDRNKAGVALEELTLYIGEPNREMGFGYPASWVIQEQNMRQRCNVKRSEQDDRRDEIEVVTGETYSQRSAAFRSRNSERLRRIK